MTTVVCNAIIVPHLCTISMIQFVVTGGDEEDWYKTEVEQEKGNTYFKRNRSKIVANLKASLFTLT